MPNSKKDILTRVSVMPRSHVRIALLAVSCLTSVPLTAQQQRFRSSGFARTSAD